MVAVPLAPLAQLSTSSMFSALKRFSCHMVPNWVPCLQPGPCGLGVMAMSGKGDPVAVRRLPCAMCVPTDGGDEDFSTGGLMNFSVVALAFVAVIVVCYAAWFSVRALHRAARQAGPEEAEASSRPDRTSQAPGPGQAQLHQVGGARGCLARSQPSSWFELPGDSRRESRLRVLVVHSLVHEQSNDRR